MTKSRDARRFPLRIILTEKASLEKFPIDPVSFVGDWTNICMADCALGCSWRIRNACGQIKTTSIAVNNSVSNEEDQKRSGYSLQDYCLFTAKTN